MRLSSTVMLLWVAALAPALQAEPPTTLPAPPAPAAAAATQESARFMRFIGDSASGGTLQTAEVAYQNDAGITVRLVSAVHIADAAYFRSLNDTFRNCDAVLYEMVKPKDARAPAPGESTSDISRLQRLLKDTLDLEFQLDAIDYEAKNFIHADLDAETFQKLQSQRGESFASLMLASLLRSLSDPQAMQTYDDEAGDALDLMTRPDGTRQLKLMLARRFGDIERHAMGLDALNGTVLLTERNKAATRVLRETIRSGKKNIAVFYGAAHMPDLADRLDLMGFRPVSTTWHDAWDVHIRQNQPSAFQRLLDVTMRAATQPAR